LSDSVKLQWEVIKFKNNSFEISDFFNINPVYEKHPSIISTNNFNTSHLNNWTSSDPKNIFKNSYDGSNCFKLGPNAYSPTYTALLDSLNTTEVLVNTNCNVKGENNESNKDILLVISIENDSKTFLWKGIPINKFINGSEKWYKAFNSQVYKIQEENTYMKVYLWNKGKSSICIDDFNVSISKRLIDE
jgi:hypothetical protein